MRVTMRRLPSMLPTLSSLLVVEMALPASSCPILRTG